MCQIYMFEYNEATESFQPRTMTLADYKNPTTFVGFENSSVSEALGESYEDLVGPYSNVIEERDNLTEAILEKGEENIADYRGNYILAANFAEGVFDWDVIFPNLTLGPGLELTFDNNLVSLYNTVPNHARPLALNLVTNTLLSHLEEDLPVEEKHDITITTQPLDQDKVVS